MLRNRRFIAAFIVAFLCLNLGGVFCLTYCSRTVNALAVNDPFSHLSEHCRRIMRRAEEKNPNPRAEANSASCCMMPAILFAAPLEQKSHFSVSLTEVVPATIVEFTPTVAVAAELPATPVYRPPPLDRSIDRLLNCVIRI